MALVKSPNFFLAMTVVASIGVFGLQFVPVEIIPSYTERDIIEAGVKSHVHRDSTCGDTFHTQQQIRCAVNATIAVSVMGVPSAMNVRQ